MKSATSAMGGTGWTAPWSSSPWSTLPSPSSPGRPAREAATKKLLKENLVVNKL